MDFRKVSTGTTLDFAKDLDTNNLETISFNLNWGKYKGQAVDLDAFLITENTSDTTVTATQEPGFFAKLFGAKSKVIKMLQPRDIVYYGRLQAQGIKHHGDDTTGAWSEGEFIEVDLARLPPEVDRLTFAILSFSGHRFSDLPFASIRVFTGTPSSPQRGLLEHELTSFKRSTKTIVMARLDKIAGEWKVTTLAHESTNDRVSGVAAACQGANNA